MRHVLAPVRNVVRLNTAYSHLQARDPRTPGIALVHGFTGAGKTTALANLASKSRALYIRAQACWTPSAMLQTLAKEAEVPGGSLRNAQLLDQILGKLNEEQRPIFVDEGDYLFHNPRMLETLRDIHDMTSVPVVLVGMEGIERKVLARPQFARRILDRVEFKPCDLEDTRVLVQEVCEVRLDDPLLEKMHRKAKGSIGLMTVALARIESFARANQMPEVGAKAWGDREMFLAKGIA